MARRRPANGPRSVLRTDLLPSNMTAAKAAHVHTLLAAYRRGAVMLATEQRRLFFETGRFNKNHDRDKTTYAAVIGAANRVQMCRYQVVGQLESWISNRANEFRDVVTRSTLDPDTKHMLHVINRLAMRLVRRDVAMKDTGEIVPDDVRRLARSIMRHVMGHHRRPVDPWTSEIAHRRAPSGCLWCGSQTQADVNAARNIGQRRALSIGSVFQSKVSILTELVRQFRERRVLSTRSGGRGSTADPRLSNPYLDGETRNAARMSGQTRAPDLVLTTST